jgi:antitoxin component YwqK of YwqJK toxin-antitoxin module
MTLLHDAYVAWMSGLTTKTNNEIHWEDEQGEPITIEPIDVAECKYVVRYYYESGKKCWEINYLQGQRHGKAIWWDKNGQKRWEEDYHQGQLHGKAIWWYENGQKECEANCHQGQRHGKSIGWYENGRKWLEEEYEHGKLIRKIL